MLALLDTGAGPNVITKRAFHRVQASCAETLEVTPYHGELRAADDKPIRSSGMVRRLPVRIGGHTLRTDMIIVEELGQDDMILGRQFLLTFDVLMDVPNAKFTIRNPTLDYKIVSAVEEKDTRVKFIASTSKKCQLPSDSITPVEYRLQRKRNLYSKDHDGQSGNWLALVDRQASKQMNRRGIAPPTALVAVNDGRAEVPILNVNDGEDEKWTCVIDR
jgi:hypothetical protein